MDQSDVAKKLVTFLSFVAGVGLYGCSNLDSSVAKSQAGLNQASLRQSVPAAEPSPPPAQSQSCARPDIFNLPQNAVAVDTSALSPFLKSLTGDYDLKSAQIYQEIVDSSGKTSGISLVSFTEREDQGDANGSGILKTGCAGSSNPNKSSEVAVPIAEVIHFPSGRVTVIDSGSNTDNSNPEAPDTSNKMLGDWVSSLPAKPQADIASDGALEFRLNWESQSTQGAVKTQAYLRYSK
jgi:hypothetical protein